VFGIALVNLMRHTGPDDALTCPYSKWSMDERQRAIKRLTTITRDARQEEQLKAMIADGSPPTAPRLWAAGLSDEDVEDEVTPPPLLLPLPLFNSIATCCGQDNALMLISQ
jgi:hypothetical protein